MSKPASIETRLLRADTIYQAIFTSWGKRRIGWFKPTLSAQISEDKDGQVRIAGQLIADVEAQITSYREAQKRAEAAGFFSKLWFNAKSKFSPVPRLHHVLYYYETQQYYQSVVEALEGIAESGAIDYAAVKAYCDACVTLQTAIPKQFISKQQRIRLQRRLRAINSILPKEDEVDAMKKNQDITLDKDDEFKKCVSERSFKVRYGILLNDYAETLIKELVELYSTSDVLPRNKYAAESKLLNQYRERVLLLKRNYQARTQTTAPEQLKIGFWTIPETLNSRSGLSDCKTHALTYYLVRQKLKAYKASIYFQGEDAKTCIQEIEQAMQTTYQALINLPQHDKQIQPVKLNKTIKTNYVQACGVVHYLLQSQEKIAVYKTKCAELINSAKADLSKMRFRHQDDFTRFYRWMTQRIKNYARQSSTESKGHPNLLGLKSYFGNREQLTNKKDKQLLMDIKSEGASLKAHVLEKVREQVLIEHAEDLANIHETHIEAIDAFQAKEAEHRAVVQVSINASKSDITITASSVDMASAISNDDDFRKLKKNTSSQDLLELNGREKILLELWIKVFEAYITHLADLKAGIDEGRLIDVNMLEQLETNTSEPMQRDKAIKALLYEVEGRYLAYCQQNDKLAELKEIKAQWQNTLRLYPDKRPNDSQNLRDLTNPYLEYFLFDLKKRDGWSRYRGQIYWGRLRQLKSVLEGDSAAFAKEKEIAFSSAPRLCKIALPHEIMEQRNRWKNHVVDNSLALISLAPSIEWDKTLDTSMTSLEEIIFIALYEPTEFARLQSELQQTLKNLQQRLADTLKERAIWERTVQLEAETAAIEQENAAIKQETAAIKQEATAIKEKNVILTEENEELRRQAQLLQEQLNNFLAQSQTKAPDEQSQAEQTAKHGMFKQKPAGGKSSTDTPSDEEKNEPKEEFHQKHH